MPEETRAVGYICPVCGQPVIAERTAFQLCAGSSTLPCPCGKSELRFTQLGDRCEITVPCLFCAKDHTAVCSTDALLRQKLLALSCSASGLGVCFIGEEAPVFRAMEQLEQAVDKLRLDDQAETRGAFLNEAVMGEVLAELRDIAARKGVRCGCPPPPMTIWTPCAPVILLLFLPNGTFGRNNVPCFAVAAYGGEQNGLNHIPGKKENDI